MAPASAPPVTSKPESTQKPVIGFMAASSFIPMMPTKKQPHFHPPKHPIPARDPPSLPLVAPTPPPPATISTPAYRPVAGIRPPPPTYEQAKAAKATMLNAPFLPPRAVRPKSDQPTDPPLHGSAAVASFPAPSIASNPQHLFGFSPASAMPRHTPAPPAPVAPRPSAGVRTANLAQFLQSARANGMPATLSGEFVPKRGRE